MERTLKRLLTEIYVILSVMFMVSFLHSPFERRGDELLIRETRARTIQTICTDAQEWFESTIATKMKQACKDRADQLSADLSAPLPPLPSLTDWAFMTF